MEEPVAEPDITFENLNIDPLPVKTETSEASHLKDAPSKPEAEILQLQEKKVRCPECKYYTTENEEKMTRHIRKMHRGENPFQCFMCDYSTYNKTCFEEHVRVHQGIKPYKCQHCTHRTVSKKNMKKHELVHRPDNPLKCQHCDFLGRHRHALTFHMRKCHTDTVGEDAVCASPMGCTRCGMKFEDKETLKRHTRNQRKCNLCDFVGCSYATTSWHKTKVHGVVAKKGQKKSDTFKCVTCGWASSHAPRVLLHLIHHPKQDVDENVFDLSILRKHRILK